MRTAVPNAPAEAWEGKVAVDRSPYHYLAKRSCSVVPGTYDRCVMFVSSSGFILSRVETYLTEEKTAQPAYLR